MKKRRKKIGFTIVELLTVMSVIALLLGILVPALNTVRRIAKDTRQRAQFHSISVALEVYVGETEQYPESTIRPSTSGIPDAAPYTVGAHHLAEALLGRDFLGFDPWTTWDTLADEAEPNIYASTNKGAQPADIEASLDRRKGPYLNPESVEAYQIAQLYSTATNVYEGDYDEHGDFISDQDPAPVLTDSYRVKTLSLPNKKQVKAGTPILYYKANPLSRTFPDTTAGTVADATAAGSIYNSLDNEALLELGVITDASEHRFKKDYSGALLGRGRFYESITNSKITTQIRPYNQKSYLLISAGFDSVFGTPDDIYNFRE